ncbi:MAG: sulfatase-like hydrolase/transferase [Flavobacteriales bacterium]|nr:sulfatase-like hydrolase/transferase [Flavobacteriales bacterium]
MFRGPLTVLLLRLGSVAALYTIVRILFWRYNLAMFPVPPGIVFAGGVRFDASAIAWINIPWVLWVLIQPRPHGWWARVQFGLFLVTNAFALFFGLVDIGYFPFSLKRSTADFLKILTMGGDTVDLAPTFARDYWRLVLFYVAGVALLAWAYHRIGQLQHRAPKKRAWQVGWRLIAIALIALATRGGTQLIPLQPMDAAKYGGASYLPVVLNTPFTMLLSLGKPTLEERNYMPKDEAARRWPVLQRIHFVPPPPDQAPMPLFKDQQHKPNVVLIILESFSALYSQELAGGDGYMPFLDSLMRQGLNFTNAYANGRRSIDGIPAILASMPQWMSEAFITSPYASLPFTSMANLLAAEGYHTSFYHGGRNGTMGFDGFANSAGFARYMGLNEYPTRDTDFDGHWGIRDHPFLQFHAQELAKEPQPFFSTVFTLSSHHPYELPEEDAEHFAGGTQPIHPTLRYTDDALRAFFTTARTMSWFENTLFVITADHTADLERTGSQGNKPIDYWVPLLYYSPKPTVDWEERTWDRQFEGITPKRTDRVTQHIDILPTVMHLIGYDKAFFSYGHDALGPDKARAIWSNNGLFSITSASEQVRYDGKQVLGVIPLQEGNDTHPTSTEELVFDLQAAIQQFNHHMLRSELVYKPAQP